jgi:hypothetical protein
MERQITAVFSPLRRRRSDSLPSPDTLSTQLGNLLASTRAAAHPLVTVGSETVSLFATAAVEMWQRSVHSFLISASLTEASPMWSSVSGYYSSHYVIRGLAHLLGYFQLHRAKRIVEPKISGNSFSCAFVKKGGNDREHRFYWKLVMQIPISQAIHSLTSIS